MSVSNKTIPKIVKSIRQEEIFFSKIEKRDSSSEKPRKHISLKNVFYEMEPKKKLNQNLIILNFITNTKERKYSAKTALTTSPPEIMDYDLCMLNKYDENLNTSLSFISDFDLEDGGEKQNDSFDSSDNEDDSVEQIEIKTKSKSNKRILDDIDDKEFDFELEKDWNDIKNLLLNKESSQ